MSTDRQEVEKALYGVVNGWMSIILAYNEKYIMSTALIVLVVYSYRQNTFKQRPNER